MTYGLFVLSANYNGVDNGCIINTVTQVASNPDKLAISVNKQNYTCKLIEKSSRFTVSVISKKADFSLFKRFGFSSGKDVNKFEGFKEVIRLNDKSLAITQNTNAYLSVNVSEVIDNGSHMMFIGEIDEAEVLSEDASMDYAYYLENVKPKPKAVGKTEEGKTIWRCMICGYEYVGEEMPEDYICPICKHPKSDFEIIENKENNKREEFKMAKWVCPVCGYVHEGEAAPEACPVCKVPGSKFTKVEGELKLAAEHEFGVYATTVKNNPNISEEDKAYIREQLFANFTGECSEVGMYLCMARVAHREGYPEVGLYWEKAAFEEAEHAAKFAELLGSELEPKMTASTKDNLAWRVDCEFGATQGKFDLALCAKKNGLDAIHDTVHEMARDEARHGKALKGLLERNFK